MAHLTDLGKRILLNGVGDLEDEWPNPFYQKGESTFMRFDSIEIEDAPPDDAFGGINAWMKWHGRKIACIRVDNGHIGLIISLSGFTGEMAVNIY